MKSALHLWILVPVLMIAACQGRKQPHDKREAGGEVLPGSVSDAMLPIDTVRSQPPLAPHSEMAKGLGKGKSAKDKAGTPNADAASVPEPMPDAT